MSVLQPTELPTEAPKLSKRAKWRKFESIADVRQALASVARRCYDGDFDPDRANACTNTMRAIGKVLHDSDLERRLRELEQRLNQ